MNKIYNMLKLSSFLIPLFLLVSCTSNSQTFKLKNILSDICVEKSKFYMENDSLIIIENLQLNKSGYKGKEWVVSHLEFKADTFLLITKQEFYTDSFANSLNSRLKRGHKIIDFETLTTNNINEKSISLSTSNDSEEIEKQSSINGLYIILLRNKSSQNRILKIIDSNNNVEYSTELPLHPEVPDFFIVKNSENQFQYVLVYFRVYFMGRNLIDYNIYSLPHNNKKKAF